jgi:hypothetical protein
MTKQVMILMKMDSPLTKSFKRRLAIFGYTLIAFSLLSCLFALLFLGDAEPLPSTNSLLLHGCTSQQEAIFMTALLLAVLGMLCLLTAK